MNIKRKIDATVCTFVVDTQPVEPNKNESKQHREFLYTINYSITPSVIKISTDHFRRSSCFNCGDSHPLKDCAQPRNFDRIQRARKSFMDKSLKTIRYHQDADQKYAHLEPGLISEKLRKALHLQRHDIPEYIYRMRKLGYPPGWLKEAHVTTSEMHLYDFDGKNVEGKFAKKAIRIHSNKIINYPGFNTPLEKEFKDEYRKYRCPSYSNIQSRNKMIETLMRHDQVKGSIETNNMNLDQSMEVKITPLERDLTLRQSPGRLSPTLNDLEKQKKELLVALEEYNSSTICDMSLEDNLCVAISTDNNLVSNDTSVEEKLIKTTTFGTPILKSVSSYERLPSTEKFMRDITPDINFENLANATGKYEQLSGILSNVRRTLKELAHGEARHQR